MSWTFSFYFSGSPEKLAFDKIQSSFLLKTLEHVGVNESFLNMLFLTFFFICNGPLWQLGEVFVFLLRIISAKFQLGVRENKDAVFFFPAEFTNSLKSVMDSRLRISVANLSKNQELTLNEIRKK